MRDPSTAKKAHEYLFTPRANAEKKGYVRGCMTSRLAERSERFNRWVLAAFANLVLGCEFVDVGQTVGVGSEVSYLIIQTR